MKEKINQRGQSLVMLLVIVVVTAIILGLGSQIIALRVKTKEVAKERIITSRLVQESLEATRVITLEDWHNIDDKTPGTEYYLYVTEGKWALTTDDSYKSPSGFDQYDRWVVFHQVLRDEETGEEAGKIYGNCPTGDIEGRCCQNHPKICYDPSTRKVTAHARHTLSGREVSTDYYLTRWENEIALQQNWSGGGGQEEPVTEFGTDYSSDSDIDKTAEGYLVLQIKYFIVFDTVPANTGTIIFGGEEYNDGDNAEKAEDTYNISANPEAGYDFSSWSTEGDLTVANSGIPSTTCEVLGNGTLQMNQIEE